MHILLTRQLEDCSQLILRFKELGHMVSHLPLLNFEKISYNKELFQDYKSIIFTSANAIKFLDTKEINKDIKCFCVGLATEKKSKKCWISKYNFCGWKCKKFKGVNITKFRTF